VVRVLDNDPEARTAEFKVKIIAPQCPTLPEALAGTNFRPVVFRNMTVTPYVEETKTGRSRVAYSLRATGVEAPSYGAGQRGGDQSGSKPARAA
jgi:hypothetical protein